MCVICAWGTVKTLFLSSTLSQKRLYNAKGCIAWVRPWESDPGKYKEQWGQPLITNHTHAMPAWIGTHKHATYFIYHWCIKCLGPIPPIKKKTWMWCLMTLDGTSGAPRKSYCRAQPSVEGNSILTSGSTEGKVPVFLVQSTNCEVCSVYVLHIQSLKQKCAHISFLLLL